MALAALQSFMSQLNNSTLTLSSLPSTVMEAIIPGYGIISKVIFSFTGMDIGLLGSAYLIFYGLFQGAQSLYYWLYYLFFEHLTSEI